MNERNAAEHNNSQIDLMAFAGRHSHISTCFLAQKFGQLTTNYRSQLDWLWWSGSGSSREIQAIYYEITHGGSLKHFNKNLDEIFTKPYVWMYWENINGRFYYSILDDS
jgi:hypothetical protein